MMRSILRVASLVVAGAGVAAASAVDVPSRSAAPRGHERSDPPEAWVRHGWHAVFPHAYAVRRRVPVYRSPSASGPVQFKLVGGLRVPVFEQRAGWWRIGGSRGRSGWVRDRDVAPHARAVMLDMRTGRLIQSFATKGQWSARFGAGALWALADTGLTRISLEQQPRFWSAPLLRGAGRWIDLETVSSADQHSLAGISIEGGDRDLVRVSLVNGEIVRWKLGGTHSSRVIALSSKGKLLVQETPAPMATVALHDAVAHTRLRSLVLGFPLAGPAGTVLAHRGRLLQRFDERLKPLASTRMPRGIPDDGEAVRASLDGSLIAVDQVLPTGPRRKGAEEMRVLDAATLRPHSRTPFGSPVPLEFVGGRWGWTGVVALPEDPPQALVRYNWRARRLSQRRFSGPWTADPRGKLFLIADRSGTVPRERLRAVETATGRVRSLPITWRRPLVMRYLPKMGRTPTRYEISALAVSPDARRVIVIERLAGDPEG